MVADGYGVAARRMLKDALLTAPSIRALQIEAGAAGDSKLVATCERALEGSKSATRLVARILVDAAIG